MHANRANRLLLLSAGVATIVSAGHLPYDVQLRLHIDQTREDFLVLVLVVVLVLEWKRICRSPTFRCWTG
jgi:hypothetical protein